MAVGFNPLIVQGSLNRIIGHLVVADFLALNVQATQMAKAMMTVTLEAPFVDQIATGTGLVNSPLPYVFGSVAVNLLRTQPVSGAWLLQSQIECRIGQVTIYPDSTIFPQIALNDCSITDVAPGPFDGQDPTVQVTVRGVYYVNNNLWAAAAASGIVS